MPTIGFHFYFLKYKIYAEGHMYNTYVNTYTSKKDGTFYTEIFTFIS